MTNVIITFIHGDAMNVRVPTQDDAHGLAKDLVEGRSVVISQQRDNVYISPTNVAHVKVRKQPR